MNDNATLSVNVPIQIPVQRIKDLLCNAIEGGSNYWCDTIDRMGDIGGKQAEYRQDVPFVAGGWLRVIEQESGMPSYVNAPARYFEMIDGKLTECYRLDRECLIRGLQTMASKYPKHFSDFLNETDDATTGDVFLQCCCFGEAIYG